MCKFTHLHVHTEASPDGLTPVDNLVARAAALGYDSLAMTDHGTLANAISFWSLCVDAHIKPIIGLEGYLMWNGNRHHITLNSMNQQGLTNLIELSNAAHRNWTSGYPVMTIDMMQQYNDGIALLTGCPASPIHHGSFADGANFVGMMKDIFNDRVWVEMMFVLDEDFTSRPYEYAQRFNLPCLVTNDVHFPMKAQSRSHAIMTECRKGFSYNSQRLWLKSCDEMLEEGAKIFDRDLVVRWMEEAYSFSQSVDQVNLMSKPTLPGATELEAAFWAKIQANLHTYIEDNPEWDFTANERYHKEVDVLTKLGFVDYFVILDDIISWARSKGIMIGPGRGSAAGSFISYLSQITDIDPLKHGLYFERFLNSSRKEYPDIDVDIESVRRQEVIDYAKEKWGATPIATYSHYSHKSLVNDLGRILKINHELTSKASDADVDSQAFEDFAAAHADVLPAYRAMDGQIRHAGKHAGGVVITDQKIPIEMVGDSLVAAWTEGYDKQLSKAGVVKYDLLGLTSLSQLKQMRERIGFVDPIPDEDPKAMAIFRDGDTLGIFQWTGSDGIRQLTMRIAPDTFTDLVVINSLYRPGALDAGTADLYPTLKDDPRLIDPLVDDILLETRGVIVFQEQVMAIIARVTGITFEESDMARRLIFKPRPESADWVRQAEKMKSDFYDGGRRQGLANAVLNQLWDEILTHTRYSFVKAHSTAYARIAYEMAWFKAHHPEVFYAAMLEYDAENIQAYLLEAAFRGIIIVRPHINRPLSTYEAEPGKLYLPLSVVKFLSPESASHIVREMRLAGEFKSIEDFRARIPKRGCNSRVCKYLWAAGAFDGLPGDLNALFKNEDNETQRELELEAFGYNVPTITMATHIFTQSTPDDPVGFVHTWKDKKNKRGNRYRVFLLRPFGSFWTDDESKIAKIKKGDILSVTKNHWGKATKISRLNFKEG